MTWVEDMERQAAEIAAEGFGLRLLPDDKAEFECYFEPGYGGSTLTGTYPDKIGFRISIERNGNKILSVREEGEDAAAFFMQLMRRGSRNG